MATSSIERTITYSPVAVKAQYDTKVSNQCSWCAHELVMASPDLLTHMEKSDIEAFTKRYAQAIDEATQLRQDNYKYKCGENIDDPSILSQHKDNMNVIQWLQTTIGEEHKDLIYPYFDKEFREVFYDRDYTEVDKEILLSKINSLAFRRRFILVSRYGQSFALVGIKKNTVMILDSHCRLCGVTTADGAYKYVLQDEGGYNKIVWAWGYLK